MLKKTMLLASLVAVTALAAPVTSAIASWSEHTSPLTTERTITLDGTFAYNSAVGSTSCTEMKISANLAPGSTGQITSLELVVPSCKAAGGLAGCTLTSAPATDLPWTMHTNGSDIVVTAAKIDTTYHGAFCPFHQLVKKGDMTISVNSADHMSDWNFSTSMNAYNATTTNFAAAVTVSGTANVTPAGTYGIT